jgi:hypothetical protein
MLGATMARIAPARPATRPATTLFPMAVPDQAQLFQRGEAGTQEVTKTLEILFSPAAISAEPPLYCSGFCSKLRAPHRGTSLSSCVCVRLIKA